MPTKTCSGCGQKKALTGFSLKPGTKDGRNTQCKECRRLYMQGYTLRRFGRRRPVLPPGHKFCPRCKSVLPLDSFGVNSARHDGRQVYCLKCWPEFVKYHPKSSEARFMESRRQVDKQRRDPRRQRIGLYVSLAVYFGDLARKPCEVCGNENVEAHHDDYAKPLVVRWLCKKHHAEADTARRNGP